MKKVLCIVTAGKGNQDELRARRLTGLLKAEITYYFVDRTVPRFAALQEIYHLLKSVQWDLVYQEGTGIAGGINVILAAMLREQPFVISSGDPIAGFFLTTGGLWQGKIMEIYERLLYKTCTGFIGWTPYLTGAAMKMGAKRAVTVEGAVDLNVFYGYESERRREVRQKYGIPENHVVCGIVGSLKWVPRQSRCQGYELVETLKRLRREDVSMLIVGDGTGKSRLEQAIPEELRSRVILTGRVPQTEVVDTINAMDIGFVTQIMGKLGNYRLSTKLPEYLACGVPIAMSPVPGFYDYAATAGWPLPPYHPTSEQFYQNCALWIDRLSWEEIREKGQKAREIAQKYFDYDLIGFKFHNFVNSILPSENLKK